MNIHTCTKSDLLKLVVFPSKLWYSSNSLYGNMPGEESIKIIYTGFLTKKPPFFVDSWNRVLLNFSFLSLETMLSLIRFRGESL